MECVQQNLSMKNDDASIADSVLEEDACHTNETQINEIDQVRSWLKMYLGSLYQFLECNNTE